LAGFIGRNTQQSRLWRAGEQGRGLAIESTEVDSLSDRSAQAAKEIKALISTVAQHSLTSFPTLADATACAGRRGDFRAFSHTCSTMDRSTLATVLASPNMHPTMPSPHLFNYACWTSRINADEKKRPNTLSRCVGAFYIDSFSRRLL